MLTLTCKKTDIKQNQLTKKKKKKRTGGLEWLLVQRTVNKTFLGKQNVTINFHEGQSSKRKTQTTPKNKFIAI